MLSVVIPVYNAPEYLKFCLQSLIESTDTLREIVLVDDCSEEETRQLIDGLRMDESLPIRLIKTRNPKHSWTNHSWNIGVSLATNPYVAVCNSDIMFEDNWDKPLIELLEAGYDCACPYLKTNNEPMRLLPYIEEIDPYMIQGSCFVVRNPQHLLYSPWPIPPYFKHWYGDRYLADWFNEEGGIGFSPESLISHAVSKSTPHTKEYRQVIIDDLIAYENYTLKEETQVREVLGI